MALKGLLPYLILIATHSCCSTLGSREALINVDKVSPGLFILRFSFSIFVIYTEDNNDKKKTILNS